jgi:hypothetical protein
MGVNKRTQFAFYMLACVSLLLFIAAGPVLAQGQGWQNEITLYGWYACIDGKVQAPTGAESDFDVDASDIL